MQRRVECWRERKSLPRTLEDNAARGEDCLSEVNENTLVRSQVDSRTRDREDHGDVDPLLGSNITAKGQDCLDLVSGLAWLLQKVKGKDDTLIDLVAEELGLNLGLILLFCDVGMSSAKLLSSHVPVGPRLNQELDLNGGSGHCNVRPEILSLGGPDPKIVSGLEGSVRPAYMKVNFSDISVKPVLVPPAGFT